MDLHIHSPIRLHGGVLSYLNTGKILPFFYTDSKPQNVRGYTQIDGRTKTNTQTARLSHKPPYIFLNKGSRLKITFCGSHSVRPSVCDLKDEWSLPYRS
jgi:hypothetical protein